jgi:hypothetical protein
MNWRKNNMTTLICKKTIKEDVTKDIIFTKDKHYDMHYVDNRWTKIKGVIGYTFDDMKNKRWIDDKFKEKNFEESYLL